MRSEQIVFLTSDRFSPWNGHRTLDPDHIWADLPKLYEIPLLVHRSNRKEIDLGSYAFGEALEIPYSHVSRMRIAFLVLHSFWLSARFGSRLLLGLHPLLALSRVKRFVLRQESPGSLTRWHRAVLQLSDFFQERGLTTVIFHGEFDVWGTTVVWACRRSGARCVAHQHFAVPKDAKHYRHINRLGRYAPDSLMCISQHQVDLWSSLPIRLGYGGSRRATWNVLSCPSSEEQRIAPYLIVPAVGDTIEIQRTVASRPDQVFHVRPHPGRLAGWDLKNVVIHETNLVDLIGKFDAFVTSSPSPTVSCTAAGQPFVKMRGPQMDGTCDCAETQVFSSLGEVLTVLDKGVNLEEILTHGCDHNLTALPSRLEYFRALE